jgi:uncharacterized protein (DUF1499 family)
MATRVGTVALWLCAGVVTLLLLRLVMLSWNSRPPTTLGTGAGRLAPCPQSPNCVSSRATDDAHLIEPLVVDGGQEAAVEIARHVIASMPRSRVVTVDGGYIHAEFKSRLFRFVDDLELLYDDQIPGFDVRSASRVGHSDLGVNRRRVESLRSRLASAR